MGIVIGGGGGGGPVGSGDITDGSVANADLANMAQATVKLRAAGAGTGAPIDGTANQLSTILDSATDPFVRTSAASGGNTITVGTYASIPAAGTAGNMYVPTDSVYNFFVDNGSAWIPYLNGQAMTLPVSGDFSWVNQSSASLDTSSGAIVLIGAGGGYKGRYKTAPATPYTVTAAFLVRGGAVNDTTAGIAFRESSTDKSVSHTMHSNLGGMSALESSNWTATTWNGSPGGTTALTQGHGTVYWFRITDNGTNLLFDYSINGVTWLQTLSVSRTAHMAGGPDQIGFVMKDAGTTHEMTLLSWKQT